MSAPVISRSSSSDLEKDIEKTGDIEKEHEKVVHALEPDFDDPNFDPNAVVLEDDSPYPEVRSAVANTDDPSMPCSTVRSWTIGLIFAIVMSGLNQFFFFRYPSVTIGNVRPLSISNSIVFIMIARSLN